MMNLIFWNGCNRLNLQNRYRLVRDGLIHQRETRRGDPSRHSTTPVPLKNKGSGLGNQGFRQRNPTAFPVQANRNYSRLTSVPFPAT